MASSGGLWVALCIVTVLIVAGDFTLSGALPIGVCYGLNGDNLPSPTDVINLYKSNGIEKLRLFAPDSAVLEALNGSGIKVSLGAMNENLSLLASDQVSAQNWVARHVVPYQPNVDFLYVTLGNEVIPGPNAQYVLPAMQNVQNALNAVGLGSIKATTVIHSVALGTSYPPSQGAFSAEAAATLTPIVSFLATTGAPLMANVYPYFACANDPTDVPLDYALFMPTATAVEDGALSYQNLFDAMVDAFYSAMEKVGGPSVTLAVAETGWPSAGNGNITTRANAEAYNTNLINHVVSNGTPKRPSNGTEAFLFAMFNEDLKAQGVEQNFGLFYPSMEPVYHAFK